MRALRTIVIVLLVSLGFLGGYFAGWYLHGDNVARVGTAQEGTGLGTASLQQRIIQELQARYYKAVDANKLNQAGINGALKSLNDPYTVYMSPQQTSALQETIGGQYVGIGAALEKVKLGLVLTSVFAGSPAAAAHLQPGDIIVTVNGQPTANAPIDTTIARIKGKAGSVVRLGVKPKAGGAVKQVTVTRRRIEIPETRMQMDKAGGKKVGYVQLYEFGGFAARDVRADVQTLAKRGAQSFILDLRYNGGGLLTQAVDVTDVFQTGVVTSTKGLHSPLDVLRAVGPVATRKPLVLLVNGYSASASEIVTGALKDHHRAKVIGTRTFGKGLVQSIVSLGNGAALKLTTAVYLTPNGTNINKKGITPDVVVTDNPKTKKDEQLQAALKYLARRP